MRFGVCCSTLSYYPRIKELGYDYVEYCFSKLIELTDEQFGEVVCALNENGLKAEAANGFFPGDIKIVGDGVDFDHLENYVRKSMERFKALGGEVAVLGSGKARNIPDNYDREKAIAQFCRVLDLCGNIAAEYGIKIVIEPLNSGETNLVNTVEDCIEMCKLCGNSNIFALADFFHVYKSGETMDAIENAGNMLRHTHLARANDDRQMPRTAEDYEACKKWAAALKKCGYEGRMSLEGSFKPEFTQTVEDVLPALQIFREIVS